MTINDARVAAGAPATRRGRLTGPTAPGTRQITPVLLYHSVSERPAFGHERWTVSPATFARHLSLLTASGRTPMTVSSYADALRGLREMPADPVLVTFDDGFADVLAAAETLAAADVPATLYATTNWIGHPGMVTAGDLRELGALGVEVGAHGRTHRRLDELAPTELRYEVAGSRDDVEQALGAPCRSLAYPHGSHDRAVREAVISAGYDSAAAVRDAFSHPADDPFGIARLTVVIETTDATVEAWLAGRQAPVAAPHELLRTRGYRAVRRGRALLSAGARTPPVPVPGTGADPVDALPVPAAPLTLLEIEIGDPLAHLAAEAGAGVAHVLVRLHGAPLGVVPLELPAGGLPPAAAARRIRDRLGDAIDRHLLADGLPALPAAAPLPVGGFGPGGCADTAAGPPDIGVVVTACEPSEELRRTLDGVRDQTAAPREVILVDNRPATSGLAAFVAGYVRETGADTVRYLPEPAPGVSRARNAGLAVVTSSTVVFTDDDVAPDRRWLASLAAGFTDDRIGCVTGMILPLALDTVPQVWFEQFGGYNKGFERRRFDLGDAAGHGPLFPYSPGAFGSGANCAFRTETLRRLGGFDPALGTGTPAQGGEDLDVFLTILRGGHAIAYEPAAILRHSHHAAYADLRRQIHSYGVGLGAMLTKRLTTRPRERREMLRRVPPGLRHLLSPASTKNARKRTTYPRALTVVELAGVARGPIAYGRSRWRHRERR